MKEAEVVACRLLEAGRNGAEALEVVEEDFDAVALGVAASVEPGLPLPRRIRVDDGLDLQRLRSVADRVRIVASVRDQRFAARVVSDDCLRDGRLVLLPRRDFDVKRAPFGVDERVDLRGEPTSRVTQCIPDDPPFPPEASWCARTIEASMMVPSSSTSSWSALKIVAQ